MTFKPWRDVKPVEDLASLADNAQSVTELFAAAVKPVDCMPDSPYVAINPSVHFDGDTWRCIVRTVNYRVLDDGVIVRPADGIARTQNVMLELDAELRTLHAAKMVDRDLTPRSGFPVHGYEDCRLFSTAGRLCATATVCDFSLDADRREMALLELDDRYSITVATPLRGAWSQWHQKNWMPKAHNRQAIDVVYAIDQGARFEIHGRRAVSIGPEPQAPPVQHRGSSQLVELDDKYLCIVHDMVRVDGRPVYLHRFVLLDASLGVLAMTERFWFLRRGIEFCAGLALDENRLVASFGVGDNSAWFAVFDLDRVVKRLIKAKG